MQLVTEPLFCCNNNSYYLYTVVSWPNCCIYGDVQGCRQCSRPVLSCPDVMLLQEAEQPVLVLV